MNQLQIIVQGKDDPKNLLSTDEKARELPNGLTVIFIENGTLKGQIGIELILKSSDAWAVPGTSDTIVNALVTENNFEVIVGAFIGCRMRFGRMPGDQWEMVRHYTKDRAKQFLASLPEHKRLLVEDDIKKFFVL